MGGYGTNFLKDGWYKNAGECIIIDAIHLNITKGVKNRACFANRTGIEKTINLKVNVLGIDETHTVYFFGPSTTIPLNKGVNNIEIKVIPQEGQIAYFGFGTPFDGDCNISIELLPKYPDGLYFDGVDDFGICEKFPIFTKEKGYTVIAKRDVLTIPYDKRVSGFVTKRTEDTLGAFTLERYAVGMVSQSFGVNTKITLIDNITFQTSTLYNVQAIKKGDVLDSDKLSLGVWKYGQSINNWNGVLYELHIFDHDLTPQQIERYIKKNIDKDYVLPKPTE